MAAPDDTKVQFNFRTPGGALINLYSSETDGFKLKELLKLVDDLAGDIATTEALLNGAGNAAPLTVPQQQSAAPAAQPVQSQGPPPDFAQPAAQPQQQAGPPAPSCQHGAMQYKSGTSAKGPWQAYFCALPKNSPGACDPQWLR